MPEFLADDLQRVLVDEVALQFCHALLGVGVPDAVGAAAPAERAVRGPGEAAAPRLAAADVVARQVADAAVGDGRRAVEAALLEALDQIVRDADEARQAALADDRVVRSRPAVELLGARGADVGGPLGGPGQRQQLVRAQSGRVGDQGGADLTGEPR